MQLVFVCSGNTCRSPLALCAWRLAVREIGARGGAKRGAAFALGHMEASSVGLCATPCAGAAPHAQSIARTWGESLADHQATLFRPQHARADIIVTMTRDQSTVLRAHFSVAPKQVRLLGDYAPREAKITPAALWSAGWDETLDWPLVPADEADILDPLGGSLEAYEACAMQIRRSVFELARAIAGHA